jgi:hypothetical protein
MQQTLGPDLPPARCPVQAAQTARRLHDLLAFRRDPRQPAGLRVESGLLSHLAPNTPQRSFLARPGAPPAPFAFPDDTAFYAHTMHPAIADARRHLLGWADVFVLPGLVLSCGANAPARVWTGSDPGPLDEGILLPSSPEGFSSIPKAPAQLARTLLTFPPGPLFIADAASAHLRLDLAQRLGPLGAPLERSARVRRLQQLDLLVVGPWRILLARIDARSGDFRTLPWAFQHVR